MRRVEPAKLTVGLDVSALDQSFKAHAARGIGRYVRALHDYLAEAATGDVAVRTFDHRRLAPTPLMRKVLSSFPAGRQTLTQQVFYPLRLKGLSRDGIELLHFPAHMDPPAWSPLRYIVSVMDLIPFVLADLYRADRPGWRFKLARFLEVTAIRNASLVLTISRQTAVDVERILGVPGDNIVVTPLGVDEPFFGAALRDNENELRVRYGIPAGRPLILYVGGIDQRKNCRGLLEVFRRVAGAEREQGRAAPVLLMAGKIQDDRQYPRVLELVRNFGLTADVCMPGFIPDSDLLQIYTISKVFLFMSLYEGFGLTPLEAMAAGTPVVSSRRSAMSEVLGDATLLIDPDDWDGAADAVRRLLQDGALADELRERGRRRARCFTWARTGELTLKAYERFLR